ncbi:unnamed protein product [Notodromas monacha]|uniref:Fibronectin type-III domain-containing protein n=1 Tax=Notodromas monacha TaxID=399045 RepID=A0A7R9GEK5_9CRUS|nr:unnamed protein product [Notodromas monacha]CAG0918156.1 unnamed protein product [Notodromas monacha]
MLEKQAADGSCATLSTQICCSSKLNACTPASVLFIANISVLLLCEVACPSVQGSLIPPKEITLVLISQSAIQVTWSCSGNSTTNYEVIYHPVEARYKIVLETGAHCQATLEQLIPSTRYQLHVSALNGNVRNDSSMIYFRTEPYGGASESMKF